MKKKNYLVLSIVVLLIVFGVPINAYADCVAPPSGLVSWWKGENNAFDSVGVNHGTMQGGATFASGKVSQAFSFDGVDDYMNVPYSLSLDLQGSLTIAAWINSTNNNSQNRLIAGKVIGWQFFVEAGGLLDFGFYNGIWTHLHSSILIPENEWVHVAATFNATDGTMKLFINGVADTSLVTAQRWTVNANSLMIGGFGGLGAPFSGRIDEVGIYNRALSALEIAAIYNAGSNGMCFTPDTTPDTFNFVSQTGMPLSTSIVSNPITVTDINYPTSISITTCTGSPCEYKIGGGSWTSSAGTVNNGDIVMVRQTSSSSNSTTTTATLTIGGINGPFNVTTAAAGNPNAIGLVAWWRAENNAYDSVGGNHGTLQGGVTYVPGKAEQAFSLESAGYVSVPDSLSLDITTVITITAWINPSPCQQPYCPIVAKSDQDGGGRAWGMWLTGPGAAAGAGVGALHVEGAPTAGSAYAFTGPGVVSNNTFTHVAAVITSGGGINIYINGQSQVVTHSGIAQLTSNNVPLTIGYSDPGYVSFFSALIDEVKIFNRALSALEISTLAGTKPDSFSFTPQTGMPLSTSIVSNPITVTGISSATAISITGGEYQVNGGSWTSSAGTVNNGDIVMVRQTSSSSNSTTTTATLTIGGVSGAFNVTTAASGDPNATGLVSWWRAENNAYDSVVGNHGTPMNGATYGNGRVSQAFSFDGLNDYVEIPHSDSLNFGAHQPMSMTLWVKRTSTSNISTIFAKRPDCGGQVHYILQWYGPGDWFVFGSSGAPGNGLTTTADKLPLNAWTFISVTFDGTTATMYINGSPVASNAMYFDPNTVPLVLGAEPVCGDYFGGLIDEVKIYNRALSAAEVGTLFSTVPDAFSFTPQTGVALSHVVESNTITVTGITNAAAIAITVGEYSVSTDGGGSWSAYSSTTPTTVSVNNQVKVRQTSSGSYSTLTTATLTIGGVSGTFNVTTMPLLHTLTINKAGTGGGTVTVNPGSVGWSGPTGTASYVPNTSVDINASADSGSSFIGFTVDCISNTSPCTVTMDSAKSVTATFNNKAEFTGTPLSGSVPHNVIFTDASTHSPTSWSWTFGDGGTSTVKNPVQTYRANGTYTVTLMATGASGPSTMTKTGYIQVGPDPCSNYPYKIGGTTYSYPTIQQAYDSPGSTGIIEIQALVFTGGLVLDQDKIVTLQGGYGCDFTSNSGDTIVSDKLTVNDGKVTVENLIVQ